MGKKKLKTRVSMKKTCKNKQSRRRQYKKRQTKKRQFRKRQTRKRLRGGAGGDEAAAVAAHYNRVKEAEALNKRNAKKAQRVKEQTRLNRTRRQAAEAAEAARRQEAAEAEEKERRRKQDEMFAKTIEQENIRKKKNQDLIDILNASVYKGKWPLTVELLEAQKVKYSGTTVGNEAHDSLERIDDLIKGNANSRLDKSVYQSVADESDATQTALSSARMSNPNDPVLVLNYKITHEDKWVKILQDIVLNVETPNLNVKTPMPPSEEIYNIVINMRPSGGRGFTGEFDTTIGMILNSKNGEELQSQWVDWACAIKNANKQMDFEAIWTALGMNVNLRTLQEKLDAKTDEQQKKRVVMHMKSCPTNKKRHKTARSQTANSKSPRSTSPRSTSPRSKSPRSKSPTQHDDKSPDSL